MAILNYLLVFLGGGAGSVLRYGIGQWVPNKIGSNGGFP